MPCLSIQTDYETVLTHVVLSGFVKTLLVVERYGGMEIHISYGDKVVKSCKIVNLICLHAKYKV